MPIRADIAARRVGNTVTITFRNKNMADRVNLWRSAYNGQWTRFVTNGAPAVYEDVVPSTSQPRYKGQLLDNSGLRDKWDESEEIWNTSKELFSDLPAGIPSIAKFTL